ncbi:MAG: hypothetical protein V3T22_13045 [Planctomycetota bacterium]
MSRALTVLGVALLWSTAGCIHPYSSHRYHHRTHGSVRVGWRHKSPPPVVHSHGHGCGHVRVGVEWVVAAPGTDYGFHAPSPTSERHDNGLHRGHDKGDGVKSQGHDKAQGHGKAQGHDKGKGHD